MAYVFWRVFMKKYSKVRLGIHRSPIPITPALPAPVTPTGRHVRGSEEESWKPSDDTASSVQQGGSSTGVITSQPKSDPNKQPAPAPGDDLSRNNEVRKSKTTRVKNYLKKCKNVALSAATGGRKDDKTAHNDTQSQHPDSAGKSSWYVPPTNTTEETSSQKRVVEIDVTENVMTIVTIDGVEETNDCVVGGVDVVESADDVLLNTIGDENCSAISTFSLERTDIDFSEKFISDNNSVFEISEISVDNTDSGYQPYHRPQVSSPDLTEAQVQFEDSIYCDSVVASDSSHPVISESVSEVASLVDRLLGPLYVNFSRTRPLLVRQARDLLVCEYLGNIARFEREFCIPASQLLQTVKDQADGKKNGSTNDQTGSSNSNNISATSPVGWPLSLGLSGVSLHLGPLAPALLRHRDCYLCVRTRSSPGLEVALVWRSHHTIGSRILAEYKHPCENAPIITCSGFESITTLEMAALDNPDAIVLTKQEDGKNEDDLPELLENLLVSVERAIERIPLDDLTFPCPQCHQYLPLFERTDDKDANTVNSCLSCQCSCQVQDNVVQKKDTSIQTSPMFEFASSIPHIDSDEDDDAKISGKLTAGGLQKQLPEIAIPKSITDLPEKLLMSGINLPGTHDTDGRALILCDAACIARAGLSTQQVATLLLFYSTLSSKEKIDKVFSVLVLAETSEEVALDVLDKAMLLVTPKMKIERFIIWRPSSDSKKIRTPKNLKYSKITCYIVCDETALESYISKPDAPACCGGSCSHDQLEWVEFYRELEPFTRQCLVAGQALASTMAEIRTDDTSAQCQITRRLLNHQQRQMSRALSNPDVQKIRRDGPSSLERLEERAQWLTGSADVRAARDHARRYIGEVQRVARRIEQLAEQRRDRLKELARLRAVEEQTSEVLQWIREVGEEKLKTHSSLCRSAADQETVRQQEQDFEKFYFIAMRYIDKAGDLLEEANQCSDPRANNLKILSQSLKLQIRVFGESLEETRESLEDVSRYFQLMERINGTSSPEAPVEETCSEMMKLAMKLGNEKLIDKSRELKQIECPSPPLPTDQPVTSTPIQQQPHNLPGRRQSVSSFAYIYKCNHHAAGFPCNCWDSDEGTISQKLKNHYVQSLQQQKCGCNVISTVNKDNKLISLGDIKEVRESAENLLDCNNDDSDNKFRDDKNDSGVSGCGKCDEHSVVIRRNVAFKRKNHPRMTAHQRMSQSCQCYSEACTVCSAADTSSASGSNGDHTEHQGDITEGGSDGFPKSSGSDELEDSDEQYRSKTLPPVQVNSHLHCHASSLHLPTETASAHLMDPKTYKTLLLIMREMIQTERDYVKSLDYIIENYIPELMREDIPQALRGQRNVVFGNVEKIYEFHSQHFLRELENCADNPLLVGQSFLRHEKKFYLYALYNKNKPKSDSLMSEYGTVFFKSKQLELKDKMDLASYLLKPVQRMGKYALLLQQLMKGCSPIPAGTPERETAEMEDLKLAEQMVRFQLRHGNDLLAMDSLRDCDVNLKEQGRLLRQNEFLVWEGRGGKKSLRQVFLFEELILFSKARRFPDRKNLDLYIYKNSIKMTDIGLTARIGDSSTKFEIWFRKRKPNDTFTLQSMSEDVKKAWTEEISQLLWKQAMRNREVRLQEMSSMGIGNKPCLDIRPSADQINDRSISFAQLSKTAPRFRNSIAGPIIETCRTNKRPQSIISVSSLSSGSTSSAGSGMTVGRHHNPQAIGYDTPVSPKTHHRSTTLNSQCSMESGIIADISLGSDDCADSGTGSHWPLQKSNSLHSNASSKSNTVISSNPQSPDEPQVMLYHVPDELSINL